MKKMKSLLFIMFALLMFAMTAGLNDSQLLCDPEYGELDTMVLSS